jgi:excisionase family DNA binding protein
MAMYSIKEVAKEFHVSEQTVRRWIESGKLKVTPLGRTMRIPGEEVERFRREGFIK